MKICQVCGISDNETAIRIYRSMLLCPKHRMQMFRYNKITDATRSTTHKKNNIIIKEDHAEVEICNSKNKILCYAFVDLEDVESIKKHKWSLRANYVATKLNGKNIYMHRFIMNYYGNLVIDHINKNKFDNRKNNLRIVNQAINSHNIVGLGIYRTNSKKKWRVYIQRNGIKTYLGTFENYDDALKVRNAFVSVWDKYDSLFSIEDVV